MTNSSEFKGTPVFDVEYLINSRGDICTVEYE